MRFVVAFVIALGLAGPASADSGSAAQPTDVVEKPKPVHPTEIMRERQKIEEAGGGGRSGFWTSRQPAQGGAYRWRLLGIGLCLIIVMGLGIVFLIKRANRANAARRDPWASKKPPAKPDDKPRVKANDKSPEKSGDEKSDDEKSA